MPTIVLRLVESRLEAADTMAFRFQAEGMTKAAAGQYLMVKLDAPDDPRNGSRSFTMANSPSEPHILIATRIRSSSPFKRRLAAMKPGETMEARGPMGKFTLHEGPAPALFLAGGIGVTPFRSIVKDAIDTDRTGPVTLLISDRTPEMIPFRREMDGWAAAHPWLSIHRTVTRPQEVHEPWNGRVGRIDPAWIRSCCADLDHAVGYVAGPPAFVDDMSATLAALGFPPERVRSERFLGY